MLLWHSSMVCYMVWYATLCWTSSKRWYLASLIYLSLYRMKLFLIKWQLTYVRNTPWHISHLISMLMFRTFPPFVTIMQNISLPALAEPHISGGVRQSVLNFSCRRDDNIGFPRQSNSMDSRFKNNLICRGVGKRDLQNLLFLRLEKKKTFLKMPLKMNQQKGQMLSQVDLYLLVLWYGSHPGKWKKSNLYNHANWKNQLCLGIKCAVCVKTAL